MTEMQVNIAPFHRFFHKIPLFKGDFSLYNSFIRKINRSFCEIHSTVRRHSKCKQIYAIFIIDNFCL